VLALGEEPRERVLGVTDRIRPRHRDRVEAERTRMPGERGVEGRKIGYGIS
jgi:hypothetical protein